MELHVDEYIVTVNVESASVPGRAMMWEGDVGEPAILRHRPSQQTPPTHARRTAWLRLQHTRK
jgi:hypothetical protein